ncbi:MAG: T9SS type A sorting domain-containing protein [Prevotella sp.]|jgi:hypothetical protein|nr:T9SS type A sorting domain-containing protein [Prevotella sp.]
MKNRVILLGILILFVNNIFSQRIEGQKSPYVGEGYETYTIKLPSQLQKDVTVVVSASVNNVALFRDTNDKFGMSNKSITLKAGKNSFEFDILWIKEAGNVFLRALNSTSSNGTFVDTKLENITVKTRGATISGPSSVIVGQAVEFYTDRIKDSKDTGYEPKWEYDTNLFEYVSKPNTTTRYVLALKAKQAVNSTNIGIQIEETVYGVGKWTVRKGTKSTSIVLPYEMAKSSDIVCPDNSMQFEIKGLDKTPGATVVWMSNKSFSLVSGQGNAKATYKALNVNDNGQVSAEIVYQGQKHTISSGNIWIGKPKTKYTEKEYNIDERNPLTIQAGEFTGKYTADNCEWKLISGKCEFTNVSGMSLTLKPLSRANENDKIKIRATVSNECGSISIEHIIHVSTMKGTSFSNPIDIALLDNNKMDYGEVRDTRIYDNDMGNLSNEVYFRFNLERIAHVGILGQIEAIVYIYDSDFNLLSTVYPGDYDSGIFSHMAHGQYYLVMEGINDNDNGEKILHIHHEVSGKGPSHHAYIGSFGDTFSFTETRNTRNNGYWNYYKSDYFMYPDVNKGNEVCYSFSLEKEMEVIIHNAGPEGQPVCTWIHLEVQDPVTYQYTPSWSEWGYDPSVEYKYENDPDISAHIKEGLFPARAYLKKTLSPGTYSVITEGHRVSNAGEWNGPIHITIEGNPVRLLKNSILSSKEPTAALRTSVVYPNPTNGIVNLELSVYNDSEALSYKVIRGDNGLIIKNGKIEAQSTPIDISYANSGLYILQIVENRRVVESHKIMRK